MKHFITIILFLILGHQQFWAVDYDLEFARHGYVDIQKMDSTILVNIKYSTTDNFMGINLYGKLNKAFLRPEIARMVVKAQKLLKAKNSDYSLIIYDAARPFSVQKTMYNKVKGTKFRRYVANPYNGGGHHNFGCAVDVSITYKGKAIDMGTEFDSFSTLSHIDNENLNLKNGTLSLKAYENRKLLRSIMKQVGFNTYRREWWHFDYYDIKFARENFKILNF